MAKELLKSIVNLLFLVLLIPVFIVYFVFKLVGVECFITFSELFSLIPGLIGIYVRRAWYSTTLAKCGRNFTVDFLGAIRTQRTRIGNNSYVGVGSWVSLADIGNDVMISGRTTILSGSHHHGMKIGMPMRMQIGYPERIRIGNDVWVGANSVIMADVSDGCVIGSGSVVTKKFSKDSILVGVPAKLIRGRE